MSKFSKVRLYLIVSALAILIGSCPAYAQNISQDQIKALQDQINTLQKQLEEVKAAQTQAAAKAAATTPAPAAESKEAAIKPEGRGTLAIGEKAKITVGGFVEAAGIYRSKNETADVGSNFNTGLPFAYQAGTSKTVTSPSLPGAPNVVNPNAHISELRGTARQSRITALAEAKPNENTKIAAYAEADFLGAAPTANSIESNSYTPRLRVAYGTVDLANCGLHFLAGQEWSMLTTNKVGITPREENIPLTIDAQYVVGFNWTRNPQIRVAEDFFDHTVWAGISLESPQTNLAGISVPGFVSGYTPGGSEFAQTSTYSSDLAPDVIGKLAFDPGYGHYEVFGITRFFHDYVPGAGGEAPSPAPSAAAKSSFGDNDAVGFGGGAGVIVPVCPKILDFQGNFMAGQGLGRYGSAQLPDIAFSPTGEIKPLTYWSAMGGFVGHPLPCLDAYVYAGYETVDRQNYTLPAKSIGTSYNFTDIGYGDFGLTVGQQQTAEVWQITGGIWDHIYQGAFGKVLLGFQYSLTSREAFSSIEGSGQHAYENIFMTSFRYYPL